MQAGDIAEAIAELIAAASKEEIASILDERPELLTDEGLELLGRMAERLPDHAPTLEALSALLMEVRALGIGAALQSFAVPANDDSGDEMMNAMSMLLSAEDSAQLSAAVGQHPVLLTDTAERKLAEIEADMSDYGGDRIAALIAFLKTCRSHDCPTAQRNYDHDIADVEAANALFAQFVFLEDDDKAEELLTSHPILLRRQAERGFKMLLDEGPAQESAAVTAMLERGKRRAEQVKRRRETAAGRL